MINSLDISNLKWDNCSGICYQNRNRINKCLYSFFNKTDCKMDITVEKRIGSNSTCAEVYLVNIDKTQVALKVLPILQKKDEINNIKEIAFATKASSLVLNDKSQFFPIVYGSSICENIKFDDSSSFKEGSENYSVSKIIDSDNTLTKKEKARLKISKCLEYKKNNLKVNANVLFSELAWGDLLQFIKENEVTETMCDNILFQVFSGINDLQTKLNLVHNDLHLGNILMLFSKIKDEKYLTCLIHDFGKTEEITNWTSEYYKEDYIKFIDAFCKSDMPDIIKEKLSKIEKYLTDYTENKPPLEKILSFLTR